MSEAKLETLEINGDAVVIDPNNLRFNESTLSKYIQTEGGFYENFGAYLARAERLLQREEMLCEKLYSERFTEAKDSGASDKKAEAIAKADDDVVELKEKIIDAKYKVTRLKRHLIAWDKNHDNAQSLGHTLRKEMDKIDSGIRSRSHYYDMQVERDTTSQSGPSFEGGDFEELDQSNLY